jgi:hypothetical protein
VSVIIPFHNRLTWFIQSVRSVLTQTFNDFELILVDDGSDSELDELKQLSDPRIRYLRQEKSGPAAARNLGISLARGKFIAFLDSDDLYLPDKLETQVRFMEEHPYALLSHTSYQRIDSKGDFIDAVPSGISSGRLYPDIIWCCLIATPTVMVRSEVLDKFRFDEDLRVGEDVLLWIQIARDCEIFGITEPLTQVRIHGENAVLDPEKQLNFAKYIMNRYVREDRSLTFRIRTKGRSSIYRHQAYLYYKVGNISRSARYLLLSLVLHPVGIFGYLAMALRLVFGPVAKRSIYD